MIPRTSLVFRLLVTTFAVLLNAQPLHAAEYHAVEVTDEATGRGVPLVQLETVDRQKFVTDSNGVAALPMEPGLVGKSVWLTVSSHGYEYPHKSFGIAGLAIELKPGGGTQLKLKRTNIAERLYRITGRGIYRDTILLGRKPPLENGPLPGNVVGQDSVQVATYRHRLVWFWGDTARPSHPLGNFFTSGAVSPRSANGDEQKTYDPSTGVPLEYLVDEKTGFTRPMAKLAGDKPLPVWIDGLCVTNDGVRQRLVTHATRVQDLKPVQRVLMAFDDDAQKFEVVAKVPLETRLAPGGHALRASEGGVEYIYFANPYPTVRVKNDWASVIDLASYEGFSCLKDGAAPAVAHNIDRDSAGKPVWKWRRGVAPLLPSAIGRKEGKGEEAIALDDSPYQLRDANGGKRVDLHYSSVFWNTARKRFVMIGVEQHGASYLGEIWYSEANAPEGPWRDAVKVATHAMPGGNMSFYNPRQHPQFSGDGRYLYFEGTYTNTFANNPLATPLYEYNQLMYRIDLTDPRLKLFDPPAGFTEAKPSKLGN